MHHRLLAWLLALVMLAGMFPDIPIAYAAGDGGFVVSLSWYQNDDPDTYTYHSDSAEKRLIRLKISYENKEVSGGYKPGELVITVPGLKGAVRSGTAYKPIAVAADDMSAGGAQKYDWSYTYSEATDTFTFVNNMSVSEKATFEGSFEIVWEISSRDAVNGFEKELTAKLRTGNGEEAVSNTVSYGQQTERDQYALELPDTSALYTAEGLMDAVAGTGDDGEPLTQDDFTWVKYDLSGADSYLARNVNGSERFECWFLEGAIVQGANLVKTGAAKEVDGAVYECWTVSKDITSETSNPYLKNVYVAYPKSLYPMETTAAKSFIDLYGTYYEEQEETLLASTSKEINLADYDFIDPPGKIYGLEKMLRGEHSTYINDHCEQCGESGAINYIHLSDEGFVYTAYSWLYVNYAQMHAESYDFELVDDIMDVLLKDGSYRQLEDGEYHFTSVVIPSTQLIVNANQVEISDGYEIELYARRAGNAEFDETPFFSGTLGQGEQEISIEDTDVVGVKALVKNVTEGIGYPVPDTDEEQGVAFDVLECKFVLHTDDPDIMTDGGQLVNNMYIMLYGNNVTVTSVDEDGNEVGTRLVEGRVWINNNFTRSDYETDREFERDRALYGEMIDAELKKLDDWDIIREEAGQAIGVDRECAQLHILEIPNQFKVSNTIVQDEDAETKDAFYFTGGITGSFTLEEGSDASVFSLYTILPDGLSLSQGYDTAETLSRALTYSCAGAEALTSAYIMDHVTLELIEDYQGSGRQYIAFHFDFSDDPITPEWIKVSGIPMGVYKNDLEGDSVSISYTMHAGMLVDQAGKWYGTALDNQAIEGGIWRDIDRDGDASETAAFSYSSVSFKNPSSSNLALIKYVKTDRTGGYVNPDLNDEDDEVPMTYGGGDYSYRLYASLSDSSPAASVTEFMFVDILETADGCEWKGKFKGIDYTRAAEIFKAEPVIYYAGADDIPEELLTTQNRQANWTADTSKVWAQYIKENWTTEQPDEVAAVAVYFGDAVAAGGSRVYIDVLMQAPPDAEFAPYEKTAVNDCLIGYDKMENDAESEHQALPSNAVPVMFVPKMGDITLIKRDAVSNAALSNATFELQRKELVSETSDEYAWETVGTYTTDVNGRIYAKDLVYGIYRFVEIKAPKGYDCSENALEVELNDEEAGKQVTATFYDTRKDGEITLTKVSDRQPELGLAGAKFTLYRADGTEVRNDLVTNENGEMTISGLEWGDYYLVETEAPKGYVLSNQKILFSINADNDAGRKAALTIENEQKPAAAVLTKYEVLEDGKTETTVWLEGAVYELYDSSGKKIGTYMTNENGKIYAENLTFGSYYFIETIAARGYERYTEEIPFTVNTDHTEAQLEVSTTDTRLTGKLWLQKLDDAGNYVKGAVYALFDADTDTQVGTDGQPGTVTFTTSEEGVIEIEGLYWGDYYIQEISSPKGYELNDQQYPVLVNKDTVENRILIYAVDDRMKGSVKLVKCNEEETVRLAGAEFTLYKNDGSIYREGLVTDKNGELLVSDIEWGSYYFLETKAPTGYGLNPNKIQFSVNYLTAGKTQEITVTDPMISCELTAAKRIKLEDIVYAHGNPTFTFRLDGTDVNGKAYTFYKTVTFSELYVSSYAEQYAKDHGGVQPEYIETSVIFTDLPMGDYVLTEVDVNRYELDSVETQNGTITADGAEFKINSADETYGAVFTNKKTDQSETSHTAQVTNIVNTQRKLTAIVVDYQGPETVTTETIPAADLVVYAVYDDGTQTQISGYTLDPETLSSEISGDYAIEVSYTENGITRKDTFNVIVAVASPFNSQFIYFDEAGNELASLNGPVPYTDADGTTYAGAVRITGYLGTSSHVKFPEVITGYIGNNATEQDPNYIGQKFKVVTVGNGTALSGITDVTSIEFEEGIRSIGYGAFYNKTNLTGNLTLPSSLVSVGTNAFWGCTGFSGTLTIPEDSKLETIGLNAFRGMNNIKGSLKFPKTLKTLSARAFNDCTNITGIQFAEDSILTSIGYGAFKDCTGLTGTLTIPSSIQNIGGMSGFAGAFEGCTGLTGLKFADDSNLTHLYDSTFAGCTGLTGALELPDTLQEICTKAFYGCTNLTGDLNIPDTVTSLGTSAFQGCSGLTGLSFAEGSVLKTIGDNTFNGCTGLVGTLTLPNSLEQIGESAFSGCNKLTGDLYIPDTVTSLGRNAFENCGGFNGTLHISSNIEKIADYTFKNCNGLTGDIVIPDGVTEIGVEAFYKFGSNNRSIGKVVIPASVTTIADSNNYNGTFGETNISGVEFKDPWNSKLTKIGNHAFYKCTQITGQIVIPGSVTYIGNWAFGEGNNVKELIILSGSGAERQIATSTFRQFSNQNWNQLASVYIPSDITSISEGDNGTFYQMGQWGPPTLYLPNSLQGKTTGYTGAVSYGDYTVEFSSDHTKILVKDSSGTQVYEYTYEE